MDFKEKKIQKDNLTALKTLHKNNLKKYTKIFKNDRKSKKIKKAPRIIILVMFQYFSIHTMMMPCNDSEFSNFNGRTLSRKKQNQPYSLMLKIKKKVHCTSVHGMLSVAPRSGQGWQYPPARRFYSNSCFKASILQRGAEERYGSAIFSQQRDSQKRKRKRSAQVCLIRFKSSVNSFFCCPGIKPGHRIGHFLLCVLTHLQIYSGVVARSLAGGSFSHRSFGVAQCNFRKNKETIGRQKRNFP